jgi:hypothetical protein
MKLSSLLTASTAAALAAGSTPGHSATAIYVRSQAAETQRHFHSPVSNSSARQAAREALLALHELASLPDWDGHGASPVSLAAYRQAYRVLEGIPDSFPLPSFGAEPDGQITFEWHHSVHRTLSVSVSPDGDLHYAALIGASRAYGTEPFLGQLPEVLLPLIQRVVFG